MSARRPRILFVSCTPIQAEPTTGVDQRIRMLYEGFAAVGDVDVYQPPSPVAANGRQLGSLRDDASKAAALYPWLSRMSIDTEAAQQFRKLNPASYDVIFLHRLGAAWWTRWAEPDKTILDLDDVPSQIYFDRMRFGMSLLRAPRWFMYRWARFNERRILDCFRCSLVCSDDDRQYLKHDRVAVIPNAFWIPAGGAMPEHHVGDGGMLFVGTLGYPPNAHGLAWFIRGILPRIQEMVPNARLTIVGRSPSSRENVAWVAARASSAVDWVGSVDDVAPFIDACTFEVCPLLRGLGTRVKILESLAHGKPVVSTTIGAHGLAMSEAEGIFRRDDPEAFAKTCVHLLTDRALTESAGRAGRLFVTANYTSEVARQTLWRLVDEILGQRQMREVAHGLP